MAKTCEQLLNFWLNLVEDSNSTQSKFLNSFKKLYCSLKSTKLILIFQLCRPWKPMACWTIVLHSGRFCSILYQLLTPAVHKLLLREFIHFFRNQIGFKLVQKLLTSSLKLSWIYFDPKSLTLSPEVRLYLTWLNASPEHEMYHRSWIGLNLD